MYEELQKLPEYLRCAFACHVNVPTKRYFSGRAKAGGKRRRDDPPAWTQVCVPLVRRVYMRGALVPPSLHLTAHSQLRIFDTRPV